MSNREEDHIRILSSVTDPRIGGPQRRILDVACRLRDRNIETELLIPKGNGEFADISKSNGFEVHEVSMSRLRPPTNFQGNIRFFRDFVPSVRRISQLIQQRNIDVVHANMAINFQTALAAGRTGVPLAWHFNDTLTPFPVKQIAAHLGKRWADEIVVAADAVHNYYWSQKTTSQTIYAPVNVVQFDPTKISIDETALREELDLDPNIPVVGTIGNLSPIKGHQYLLRAVAKVIDNSQQIAVPIVGAELDSRNSYAENLRNLRSKLGIEDQVRFVGFRSNVPELLSLFDVFVLPSIAEACPIVVLEAMAMERPIVATNVGGVSEEIPSGDYGWLVPPKNSTALADAIQEVLENPEESKRRASNARNRAESKFSLTACVDRHEDLYRSLVEE